MILVYGYMEPIGEHCVINVAIDTFNFIDMKY